MKKMGPGTIHWLKTVHIVLASLWLGGALSVLALQVGLHATSGGELFGHDVAMKLVDDFVIIPAAIGTLLTGLLYSVFTKWGFFRHGWVIAKWVITLAGIVFGTFWLGPWLNALPPLSASLGMDALAWPEYLALKSANAWGALVQVSALALAVWLSVFKPWPERRAGRT